MTFGTYSDSRGFSSMKSHHSVDPFKKKLMVGAEDMKLLFRIRVYIKLLPDNKWFNILRERFHKLKVLRIWDVTSEFHNFSFSRKTVRYENSDQQT